MKHEKMREQGGGWEIEVWDIGFKSRVSEILSRKRKLTLDMIRKINRALHIPAEVLVKEY